MTRLRLAILISGQGTNMDALLRAAEDPAYPAEPVLVISNRPGAPGLGHAANRGIATAVIDHKPFADDRAAFEERLEAALDEANVEIIALAGFMRILTLGFTARWAARMVNIHPSLLPKYPGLKTHERALESGDAEHGCTVHWVSEIVDAGSIIAQARVPVLPDDTPETLRQRVLAEEHRLYPEALAKACAAVAKLPPRRSNS